MRFYKALYMPHPVIYVIIMRVHPELCNNNIHINKPVNVMYFSYFRPITFDCCLCKITLHSLFNSIIS